MEPTPDVEVEAAYDWLWGHLPKDDRDHRRANVKASLQSAFQSIRGRKGFISLNRLESLQDQTAWYMYLVELSQHHPTLTDENQASRVLPVFKRLGQDLDTLKGIRGVEQQVAKLFGSYRAQPDSVLFELLVALLWAKNGYEVEFVPVSPPEKRPDFRAARNGEEWFVETKRLAAVSEYSKRERLEWHRIWQEISRILKKHELPLVLDICFHEELSSVSTQFVADALEYKLPFVTSTMELIADEVWSVSVSPVDMVRLHSHFQRNYVKATSRQLLELIGGRWDRTRGFSHVMKATFKQIGEGIGFNAYVDQIDWAAGAYWHCDAVKAIQAKARDIRGHLADAVQQLPPSKPGVIHVGLETNNGEVVELERYQRILNTVAQFDPKGADLRWIYTHLYESYAPPSHQWSFDETTYCFGAARDGLDEPLSSHRTVTPTDETAEDGVHWLKEPPE